MFTHLCTLHASFLAAAAPVSEAAAKNGLGKIGATAVVFFLLFIVLSLGITFWAARHTRTTSDFFVAGGGISAWQNGFALAGDFMSAASFLGIAGLVAKSGFDGLMYSTGFLVGWPLVLFLIAESLRAIGKYTFADVVAYRLRAKTRPDRGGLRDGGRGHRFTSSRKWSARASSSSSCSGRATRCRSSWWA